MGFKKEDTQSTFVFVKTEDRDVLLSPSSVKQEQTSQDSDADLSLEVNKDSKLTHGKKRIRYFIDAIVIPKRDPEARFDSRYKQISSLITTTKKETPCPEPAAAGNQNRKPKGKVAIQIPKARAGQRVKTEPRDDMAYVPLVCVYIARMEKKKYSTWHNIQKPGYEGPSEHPTQLVAEQSMKVEPLDVKIREESPMVGLDSVPGPSNAQEPIEEAMKKWINPKAKVKKEAATLSGDSIRARLTEAGISMNLFPINCDKAILDTEVSREFMSKIWGGSSQETFPRIGTAKLAEHGLRDFMYLPDNYQPVAPKVPGAPGIWIDENGDEGDWQWGIQRVFTRIRVAPAVWMYQGQYEIKRARSMTKEEWARQTPAVRNTWARELCRKGWGTRVRANIYSIKHLGRLPTMAERDDILDSKLHETIGIQEVALALTCGDATMALYTMKCVGYDKAFAKQVHDRWATWVPPVRKPKGSGKRKAGNEARPGPGKARLTKKQKLEEDVIIVDDLLSGNEEEEEYDEDGPESDAEMETIEEVAYMPRGTKTRPRI